MMGYDIKAAGFLQGIKYKIEKNLFHHVGIAFYNGLNICVLSR